MNRLLLCTMLALCSFGHSAQAPDTRTLRPQQAQVGERRLALVIGNDGYQCVSSLRNAKADAEAIAEGLKSSGFTTTIRFDLPEKDMKATLRGFKSQIQGGDVVVFYFSGHGVQLGGANYLLPIDIRGESEDQVKDEAIPLQRILDDLQEQKAKFTLAILDACRNNPFKGTGRALGGRGLAPTTAATGQMVLFSAGVGQQALDALSEQDPARNGLFTRVLLKEMRRPGLSVDRVLRNVRDEVVRLAREVGHDQVPALYDQALGEFYFVPGQGGTSGSQASAVDTAPPPVAPVMTGNLQVAVNAPGATVYLDGQVMGTASPSTVLNLTALPTGGAVLKVEAQGYLPREQNIKIEAGKWIQVTVALTKRPESSSEPARHDVTVAIPARLSGRALPVLEVPNSIPRLTIKGSKGVLVTGSLVLANPKRSIEVSMKVNGKGDFELNADGDGGPILMLRAGAPGFSYSRKLNVYTKLDDRLQTDVLTNFCKWVISAIGRQPSPHLEGVRFESDDHQQITSISGTARIPCLLVDKREAQFDLKIDRSSETITIEPKVPPPGAMRVGTEEFSARLNAL